MYDTIKGRLETSALSKSALKNFIGRINIDEEKYYPKTNSNYLKGHYKNLPFSISEHYITLQGGSICKFHCGDNQQVLSRGETQRAFEHLSDEVGLNTEAFTTTRIDVANNIITHYQPLVYYPYFIELAHHKRESKANGLYFTNSNYSNLFYGKLKEQKLKGADIPQWLENQNILRYEARITGRINQFFNCSSFTFSDLYNEQYYMQILDHWKKTYFKIKKANDLMTDYRPTGSTKDLVEYMALQYLKEQGLPSILSTLDQWQNMGVISPKQKHDLKLKIRSISNSKRLTEKSPLVREIDEKVSASIMHYR